MSKPWYVYVAQCSDASFYCGITTNIEKRIHHHNHTRAGAKYTRSRRPVKLIFSSQKLTRSQAASIEAKFKKLSRKQKELLIQNNEYFNTYFNLVNHRNTPIPGHRK